MGSRLSLNSFYADRCPDFDQKRMRSVYGSST